MNDTHITISKADLADLASFYYWWLDARCTGNHIGVSVYGGWLRDLQDRIGAEVVDRDDLVRSLDRARELANV